MAQRSSTKWNWVLAGSLLVAGVARAEEWPQYRGPKGDGIVREEGLAKEWPAEGPKKLWSVPTGIGHSSPLAVEGKLYLFTRDEEKGEETLSAFDAESGKTLWSKSYAGGWTHQNKDWRGTRATPLIDGDKIYTYGGGGDLYCRALADGKEIWNVNVLKETNAQPIEWGESSTPLIVGDLVYVQGGRGNGVPVAVAVNEVNGKIAWQSEAKGVAKGKAGWPTGGGYAQPAVIDVGGTKQLIIFGGTALYAMDPQTGKTIWQETWETSYDVNATAPIWRAPHLLVSSGYKHGSMMLDVSPGGAKKLWESDAFQSKYQGCILDGDFVYGNSEGILKCIHWPDGKVVWEAKDAADRLGPGGSIVRFGEHLITLSERGKLTLAKATGEGYKRISSVNLTKGTNLWATPLVYKGKLYVKGVEELICLDISGK